MSRVRWVWLIPMTVCAVIPLHLVVFGSGLLLEEHDPHGTLQAAFLFAWIYWLVVGFVISLISWGFYSWFRNLQSRKSP